MSNTSPKDGLSRRLQQLEKRVKALEEMLPAGVKGQPAGSAGAGVAYTFSDLPSSLSKSLQAMQTLGEGDATAVSQKTGRNRSVETIYLNQLVRLGNLSRRRLGKKVFFRLAKVY